MRTSPLILILIFFCACNSNKPSKNSQIQSLTIDTLLQDSLLSIRALEVNNDAVVAATSDGVIYKKLHNNSDFNDTSFWEHSEDTWSPNNFRALAFQGGEIYALTIGNPAKLFRDGELMYYESKAEVFYDAMAFWNDNEGIAIGDPTDQCMSIVVTRDGGNTWHKISCDYLPKVKQGEAAFAASDTNIAIFGDHTWVATGGKSSRILYSSDRAKTWRVYNTPIVQGKTTTGIYSIDFYNASHGFAIGGDYTDPKANVANKIRTSDGGKTWTITASRKEPGYRSCVQYIPNSGAKSLVTVGFDGIDYSNDFGETWQHLSDESFYTIRFLNDSVAYAGGKGKLSKLTFSR